MHNPKNGYFKMPNDFFEALIDKALPTNARRIVDFIIRESWGYRKRKTRYLKYADFCLALKMQKAHVSRELARLREANIVTYLGNRKTRSYQIQRDFTQWKELPKQVTIYRKLPKQVTKSYLNRQHKVTYVGNQKSRKALNGNGQPNHKDIIKDISLKTYQPLVEGPALQLAKLLFTEIRKNKPDFKEPNPSKWERDMDLLIRIDKRNPDRVGEVICWAQQDNVPDNGGFCWATVILSPGKLRKQFDLLEMKMNTAKRKGLFSMKHGVLNLIRKEMETNGAR